MRIQILLFEGFEELDVAGPYEVFQKAKALGAPWTVELVTLQPREFVTAAFGMKIHPQGRLDVNEPPDIFVIPGGGWVSRSARGSYAEVQKGEIPEILSRFAGRTVLCGVCTGTMLLAAAGITKGRRCVTHHSALEDLRATGAIVEGARVVDNGDLITCSGVTSGIDLALWVVERFVSPLAAAEVNAYMEYPRSDHVVVVPPVDSGAQ